MRAHTQYISGTGTTQPMVLDHNLTPPVITVAVNFGTGTGAYTLQGCLDDYYSTSPNNLTWYNLPVGGGTGTAGTASGIFNVGGGTTFYSALRLIVGTAFPSGNGTFIVTQSGFIS